mgnify:CR=1 FL=1
MGFACIEVAAQGKGCTESRDNDLAGVIAQHEIIGHGGQTGEGDQEHDRMENALFKAIVRGITEQPLGQEVLL